MNNKDLFKQAIAEAKTIREAAITNAKEALEESITPHLKEMLAQKLQEIEDNEAIEEYGMEHDHNQLGDRDKDGDVDMDDSFLEEAEEEGEEEPTEEEGEQEGEEEEELEIEDMSVEDLKDLIRDIVAQETGAGEQGMEDELPADDLAGEDMTGMEDGEPEIDINELLRELEEGNYGEVEEGKEPKMEGMKNPKMEGMKKPNPMEEDLYEALKTVNELRKQLQEVNLLNAKLLYVNKVFKSNNLSEGQKVNVIAAFDNAETVREVKLVFETVSKNVVAKKVTSIKEHTSFASKPTGTTKAPQKEVINEVSEQVLRMQKLAGIIK